MAGQGMNTGKGINRLGVKPGFVKGGSTRGKNANGSGTIGGGDKTGGVSLDGGYGETDRSHMDYQDDHPPAHSKGRRNMGQRGSASPRGTNTGVGTRY